MPKSKRAPKASGAKRSAKDIRAEAAARRIEQLSIFTPGQIVCVEYKGVPGYIGRFRCVETRYSKGINYPVGYRVEIATGPGGQMNDNVVGFENVSGYD